MLILTRKIGETLLIGDDIRVVILDVRGKQVRLGIEAPPDVVVLREEVLQRLAQENVLSAAFQFADFQDASLCARNAVKQSSGLKNAKPSCIAVKTRDFGEAIVSESEIIEFPQGLPGFPQLQRYALIENPEIAPFLCLQSLDDPGLAFVAADPVSLLPDYRLSPLGSVLKELQAQDMHELKTLVLLTIPPGQPREITANLTGPILINPRLHRGKQIMVENSRYSQKHHVLARG